MTYWNASPNVRRLDEKKAVVLQVLNTEFFVAVDRALDGMPRCPGKLPGFFDELHVAGGKAKAAVWRKAIRATKTEAKLLELFACSPAWMSISRFFKPAGFDWKELTQLVYGDAGTKIVNAATRAMLDPHTRMGKRRLMRNFARLKNNAPARSG